MKYAVVLYMNEEKTSWLTKIIRELERETGSEYMRNIPPHITIAGIVSEDEAAVQEAMKKISKEIRKGQVVAVSIGVFNPSVLFVAPVLNDYLHNACEIANKTMLEISEVENNGNYMPYNWVPHIAVAQRMDKEGLYRGFEKLSNLFNPFMTEIDRIALIKSEPENPYQELAVYALT